MQDTTQRYHSVCEAIRQAESEAQRPAGSVQLIAVSKTISAEGIRPVLGAGHRVFGENYVQESAAKWPTLRQEFPDVKVHMIGPLQSNKAKEAVRLFDVIQSVDRLSLVKELARAMDKTGKRPDLLIQVNTGAEPQKAGVLPEAFDGFLAQCRDDYHLPIIGLMCIPPADEAPALHFQLLANIAKRHGLPLLSMGMSADYKEAIQLGASHVRVGTAIFGARG